MIKSVSTALFCIALICYAFPWTAPPWATRRSGE